MTFTNRKAGSEPMIARIRAWLREFGRGWNVDVVHPEDVPTARERDGLPYDEGQA